MFNNIMFDLKFFLLINFCLTMTYDIPELTAIDQKAIHEEYLRTLNAVTQQDGDYLSYYESLVPDVSMMQKNDKKVIAVLDVGGSYYKVAYVEIIQNGTDVKQTIIRTNNYPYPKCNGKSNNIYWYDWAADMFLQDLVSTDVVPDSVCLIFSYPIRYANNKNDAFPLKFSKFWCFEDKESLRHEIKQSLSSSIIQKCKSQGIDIPSKNLKVRTVLNDAVATLFASKSTTDMKSIGIILGTGTNGSFFVKNQDTEYAYNSEWGAFTPSSYMLLPEEQELITTLDTNYNFLDVICGNGYKYRLMNIINNKYMLGLPEITDADIPVILSREDNDTQKQLLQKLLHRSRQIMVSLVSAIVMTYPQYEVALVLNGSGFSNESERCSFHKMTIAFLESMNQEKYIEICYGDGYTFIGASYYDFCNNSDYK